MTREHVLRARIDPRGAQAGANVFVRATNSMAGAVRGLGAAYVFAQGARTAAGYETTLVRLRNVSRFAAKDTADLTRSMELQQQAIEQLNETTVFTSNQVAQALTGLRKTGASAEESVASLGDVLNLAQVGMLKTDRASKLVIRTQRQFALAFGESERVVDAFTAGAALSSAEITDIAEAFKFLAPIASEANLSLEQTVAVAGALIDTVGVGSIAGTGGRRLFTFLAESLDSVGFEETLRRLPEQVTSLSAAFQDFSIRGAIPAITLAREFNEVLEDEQRILGARGVTAEQAIAQTNTLAGAWAKLIGQAEGFIIKVSNIGDAIEKLTGVVEKLGGAFETAGDIAYYLDFVIRGRTGAPSERDPSTIPARLPPVVVTAPRLPQFNGPGGSPYGQFGAILPQPSGGFQGLANRGVAPTQLGNDVGDAVVDTLIRSAADWDFSNFGRTVMQQINRSVLEAATQPLREIISGAVSAASAGLGAAFGAKPAGGEISGHGLGSLPPINPGAILGP